MAHKAQDTVTTHAPVTVRVRCNGDYHHVTWLDHRLVLKQHSEKVITFMEALDTPSDCVEIVRTLRVIHRNNNFIGRTGLGFPVDPPKRFPLRLWEAVLSSVDSIFNGYLNPIEECLKQRTHQTKLYLPKPGFTLSTKPPQIAVWIPGMFVDQGRPLAIHRDQQWKVDWHVARALSSTMPSVFSEDEDASQLLWAVPNDEECDVFWDGCSLCGYRDHNSSLGYFFTPRSLRHAQSQRHRRRFLAAIATVFEVSLPDNIYGRRESTSQHREH